MFTCLLELGNFEAIADFHENKQMKRQKAKKREGTRKKAPDKVEKDHVKATHTSPKHVEPAQAGKSTDRLRSRGVMSSFFFEVDGSHVPRGGVIALVVASLILLRYCVSMFPHSGDLLIGHQAQLI